MRSSVRELSHEERKGEKGHEIFLKMLWARNPQRPLWGPATFVEADHGPPFLFFATDFANFCGLFKENLYTSVKSLANFSEIALIVSSA